MSARGLLLYAIVRAVCPNAAVCITNVYHRRLKKYVTTDQLLSPPTQTPPDLQEVLNFTSVYDPVI